MSVGKEHLRCLTRGKSSKLGREVHKRHFKTIRYGPCHSSHRVTPRYVVLGGEVNKNRGDALASIDFLELCEQQRYDRLQELDLSGRGRRTA